MTISNLVLIPLVGIFSVGAFKTSISSLALLISTIVFVYSIGLWLMFDFSINQFQFVQEVHNINLYDLFIGADGLSIYFVLLTTIIIPIALISNWKSIQNNVKTFLIIMLLLEVLLLAVFLVLDIFLFYIFFESILPPLFLLIGLYGSDNRVRASFYLFLYTFLKCIRAKFRESPKALTTKDLKETLSLAPLMPGGMVISLKILAIKWAIVDLSQTMSVKEQRVDGSLISNEKNS